MSELGAIWFQNENTGWVFTWNLQRNFLVSCPKWKNAKQMDRCNWKLPPLPTHIYFLDKCDQKRKRFLDLGWTKKGNNGSFLCHWCKWRPYIWHMRQSHQWTIQMTNLNPLTSQRNVSFFVGGDKGKHWSWYISSYSESKCSLLNNFI